MSSSRETFPEIRFGKSAIGKTGGDYPADELTDADAADNIVTEYDGVDLVFYRGLLVSRLARKLEEDKDFNRIRAREVRNEDRFLSQAGFE